MDIGNLVIERNDLAKKEVAGVLSESEKIRLKKLRIELYNPPPFFFTLPRTGSFNEL